MEEYNLMNKKIIVLTYGTFDLFHIGHVNLLRRAKKLGNHLIVGLSTDTFNSVEKNKKTFFSFEERKEILLSTKYVDEIIPETSWEQKITDVKKYNADIFVIGDDWKGKFDFLQEYCEVVYLPRTQGVSSSLIKKMIHEIYTLNEIKT